LGAPVLHRDEGYKKQENDSDQERSVNSFLHIESSPALLSSVFPTIL
jgi:hypothetical protein